MKYHFFQIYQTCFLTYKKSLKFLSTEKKKILTFSFSFSSFPIHSKPHNTISTPRTKIIQLQLQTLIIIIIIISLARRRPSEYWAGTARRACTLAQLPPLLPLYIYHPSFVGGRCFFFAPREAVCYRTDQWLAFDGRRFLGFSEGGSYLLRCEMSVIFLLWHGTAGVGLLIGCVLCGQGDKWCFLP